MSHNTPEFYPQSIADFYQIEQRQSQEQSDFVDLEQVNQFQPEFEPRSTTTATTDLYASSQIESNRHRDQGDPDEYGPRFEDQ